jgi:hypothetical protein
LKEALRVQAYAEVPLPSEKREMHN